MSGFLKDLIVTYWSYLKKAQKSASKKASKLIEKLCCFLIKRHRDVIHLRPVQAIKIWSQASSRSWAQCCLFQELRVTGVLTTVPLPQQCRGVSTEVTEEPSYPFLISLAEHNRWLKKVVIASFLAPWLCRLAAAECIVTLEASHCQRRDGLCYCALFFFYLVTPGFCLVSSKWDIFKVTADVIKMCISAWYKEVAVQPQWCFCMEGPLEQLCAGGSREKRGTWEASGQVPVLQKWRKPEVLEGSI